MRFQRGFGDWRQYRSQFGLTELDEIDLHFGERDRSRFTYAEVMAEVVNIVMGKLREAQLNGRSHVMIIHGSSTSRRGKTTARSQVRGLMRSKHATPLIDRKGCIQHNAVFLARLKEPKTLVTARPAAPGGTLAKPFGASWFPPAPEQLHFYDYHPNPRSIVPVRSACSSSTSTTSSTSPRGSVLPTH